MADIPKDVFDYAIQSQIATGRHANKVVHDILSLLNAADAEILAKLEKWGDSERFTPARLRALLDELRKLNAETYAQAHNELKSGLLPFGEHVAADTVAVLATRLPFDFNLVSVTPDQLESIISETPIVWGENKAKLLEETFADLAAGKEASIRGAIRLGQIQGEGIPEIVRRIKGTAKDQYKDGILEISRRDCATIVRTACNFTSNQAMQATYKANAAVVKSWLFLATLDSRVSVTCASLSGSRWNIGEGPIPPRHPNCRSTAVPELATFKELGIDLPEFSPGERSSKDGPVSSDITFQSWLKGQPKSVQVDILGKTRQELFASGGLKIDKFTNDKGIVYSLDQLKERNATAFKKAFGA